MYHHSYSVAEDAHGDADPLRAKRQQREEARVSRLKRLQKSRITLGGAFPRWKSLLRDKCFKSHADVAFYLLDSFEQMSSASSPTPAEAAPPAPPGPAPLSAPVALGVAASSGTDSDDPPHVSRDANTHQDLERSLPWRATRVGASPGSERANAAAPVERSQNGKATEPNGRACERADGPEAPGSAIKTESCDEEEGEESGTAFSVGDGQHTVDLGSPSELVVDEAHLLRLFRSCRKCNQSCGHTKRLEGLKLVVSQSCAFCKSSCEWTNLSDGEDHHRGQEPHPAGLENGDARINGNDTALSPGAHVR